jgi:2-keto-3-deoxy-L-rhamnonate aldolase RhmA
MNPFLQKLTTHQVGLGALVSFADATVSELMAGAGLDFIWIDMEHGPLSLAAVQAHVMAAQLGGAAAVVRVPSLDPVVIKQVLELGADGIVVPMVNTAAEARAAVAASRYPPLGTRGYGPRRSDRYGRAGGEAYVRAANAQVMVIVQIEHIDAVRNLDELLQTPGLAAVVVGPADLSASLGVLPQTTHPQVVQAIETVIARCQHWSVSAGIYVSAPAAAREWLAKGMQWVCLGSDVSHLTRAIDAAVAAVREGGGPTAV